jgi:hypothetical protein
MRTHIWLPVPAHLVLGNLHLRMHGAAGPAPLLAATRRCTAGLRRHRHVRVGTARHICSPPRHQRLARNDNDRRGAVALHLLHRLHRWPAVALCGAGHEPALGPCSLPTRAARRRPTSAGFAAPMTPERSFQQPGRLARSMLSAGPSQSAVSGPPPTRPMLHSRS